MQTVIIAKLDRLTRSVKDLCTLLDRFTRRGVALVSVAESLDTGSAAGRLVLNIMTAVSQWEREAIGERTRDAISHKRTNGEGRARFSSATAWARTGSTSSPTLPNRRSYRRSTTCAIAATPSGELRPR